MCRFCSLVGGHPQHFETEEAVGQIGAGLRFCQSEVCPFGYEIERDLKGRLFLASEGDVVMSWRQSDAVFVCVCLCVAKRRWLQATKSIISGTNTQALTAKADLLKEEVDEAMNKVELCKVSKNELPQSDPFNHPFHWHAAVEAPLRLHSHENVYSLVYRQIR